jgi:hypothetical protein
MTEQPQITAMEEPDPVTERVVEVEMNRHHT